MSILGLPNSEIKKIETAFQKIPVTSVLQEAQRQLADCTPEERLCLMAICAYLPASDLADYPISYFKKSVQDTLAIRETLPWKDLYTGELFLNYILPVRYNNENLTDHRMTLYSELYPRVKDLTPRQAALEVNYWCYEKAIYRTTDFRTAEPLTILRNTYGRCGEESVLCVAALRSVGIAARQCYTPKWAHCDDNHAWVEVYIDGTWHFIGACEPEAQLDKGWFTEAASRAMLVHARTFSHMTGGETVSLQTPIMTQINIMKNYAETKNLQVHVTDAQGKPVPDALVHFQVLNFSQLSFIAKLKTDENGDATLLTGKGDLFIHADKDNFFGEYLATAQDTAVTVSLTRTTDVGTPAITFSMNPPPAALSTKDCLLSPEAQQIHEEKMEKGEGIRKTYQSTFVQGEAAAEFAKAFPGHEKQIAEFLTHANGNHREICAFLNGKATLADKVDLLSTLNEKDFSDITFALLESHLENALPFAHALPRDIFVPYVLAPRVAYETINDFRPFITGYFTPTQQAEFKAHPEAVWAYLRETIQDCGTWEYETLSASPKGLLTTRYGSLKSVKIVFVSICRSLGIPARLNPADQEPEFWAQGEWHRVVAKTDIPFKTGKLTLIKKSPEEELVYHSNFCIERLVDGAYAAMNLDEIPFEGEHITYTLAEGEYRVTLSNRLINGAVEICLYYTAVPGNGEAALQVALPKNKSGSETAYCLPEIPVLAENGVVQNLLSLFPENLPGSTAYLETGREPTEHLLNEILEQPEAFRQRSRQMILLVHTEEEKGYPLLEKVVAQTGIQVFVWAENQLSAEEIRKAVECPSKELPLVLGLNAAGECVFSVAGYHVGTGQLLLNHFKNNG